MLFDPADLDKVRPPRPGAPVKGNHGEEAWARAAEDCAGEIQSLPMPARDQLLERLSREMELAVGHRGAGFGRRTVSDGVVRLRTTSIDIGDGMAFNLA